MEALGVFGLIAFMLVAKLMKDVDDLKKKLVEAEVLKD